MPFLRKYNTLLVAGTTAIRIPIIKRAVVDFAVGADWTPAAGDVKVLVDNAAAANITNLPTAIASGNTAVWEFVITAAELTCKQLVVTISDSATKAIEDQSFIVETFGNASAMYVADVSLANFPANVTQLLGTAWLTPTVAGTPDVNTKTLTAGAIGAAAIADGALDAPTFTATIGTGTVTAGSSTTSIVCSAVVPTSAVNDQFKGRIIVFDRATTTAALRGQATDITAYTHATITFTVTALTTAPASGDTFHIV